MTETTIPDGWRLVPVEPTEAMLAAGMWHVGPADGEHLCGDLEGDDLSAAYRAMLAAAPSPLTELQRLGQEDDARVGEEERARELLMDLATSKPDWQLPEDKATFSIETAVRAMLAFASSNTRSVREEVLERAASTFLDAFDAAEDEGGNILWRQATDAANELRDALSSQDKKDG